MKREETCDQKKRALREQRGELRRKKKENFTRRRCWWSERRDEKEVRDSGTKRERETTRQGTG